jgi:hypothetical protein|nr:MAG TPA_asm: hypothetical protein [Caudoviricetes sp.]
MATTLKGAEQKTLQDALLDAIDYMTTAKMDKLTLDKTVVATIVKNEDLLKNTYRIRYQGNENLIAKAQSGDTYKKGQQVYVLVPQNDLSNDKIILGTASVDNASSEAGFISSVMNDYTYSGENAFLSSPTVFGLRSNYQADKQNKKDSALVYGSKEFLGQAGDQESPYIVNTRFGQSAKNSEKIMLKAEFRTSLPSYHRMPNCGGEYGLKVILSFNTNDVYYYVLDGDNKEKTTKDDGTPYTASDEGVQVGHKKRYQLYTLESSSSAFTGQPFNYPSFTEQYAIFDFDAKNFNAVESVVVYCQGFPLKEGDLNEPENIFIRNVQIYGLSRITAVQGDYSLRLNPATLVFSKSGGNNTEEDREVSTRADFRKKSLSLSSDVRMKFVWGTEDKTITSVSDGYNGYLGSGWKEIKNIGNSAYFSTKESDNLAYENKYKCSAIYSGDDDTKVILVQEFIVYNMNSKRDIEITSNLGTEFAFDNGTPTLTCSVKDDEGNSFLKDTENEYIFVWSITTEEGTSRQIYSEQEAQKKVDDIYASLNQTGSPVGYADYAQAKNDRALASGVKYGTDANNKEARYILTLPISSVASSATVYCTVYQREKGNDDSHNIGTASITLKNSKSVEVARYHIIIENGTQSFQYSEIGISPCDEKYNGLDYQEILPLTCHFFDPQGLEVPASEYVIQWSVPTSDSFFTTNELDLSYKNPADDTGEQVSNSQVLTFKIQSRWRYAYTNRQITAIVTYQGEEFRKDTEFLFAKIGDNGTNGTDYVVKIVPKDNRFFPLPSLVPIPEEETKVTDDKGNTIYSYHNAFYEQSCLPAMYMKCSDGMSNETSIYPEAVLTPELYQRGTKATASGYSWDLVRSGGRKKTYPFTISDDGTLGWSFDKERALRGQVIRVSSKVNIEGTDEEQTWDTVYGFYPMPVVRSYINSENNSGYTISLNKTYTLQQVLYNSDGKYPQYDTDRGFKIDGVFCCDNLMADTIAFTRVNNESLDEFTVKAFTYGGQIGDPTTDEEGVMHSSSTSSLVKCEEAPDQVGIKPILKRYVVTPSENYSGAYQNNGIYIKVQKGNSVVCDAWIPVYMSLNRYSLASLNKWDGNSIEIKNEEKERSYILAPQIGAGIKGKDNSFTGIVMGSRFEQVEDAEGKVTEQNDVGLFGYHEGKQSIFLDSKTGDAVFGLPEEQADEDNGNYEGRIILAPGGESTIANLTLASNTIYGASRLKLPLDWEKEGEAGAEDELGQYVNYWPKEKDKDNNEVWITRVTKKKEPGRGYSFTVDHRDNYLDNFEYDRKLNKPYTHYPVVGARLGIPPEDQGILLSSTPPYFSAKGHPLNEYNSDINWKSGMRSLAKNDSLEVEIDPNKTSIFSIYRHHKKLDSKGNPVYERYPIVGIDATGSFYTNSVKQENTTMTINRIGAFGLDSTKFSESGTGTYPEFLGVNFAVGGETIIKMFEATNPIWLGEHPNDDCTFITTGTNIDTEYYRGIRMNAKTFDAYVSDSKSTDMTTPHKLILKQNENFFGTEKDTFLNMVHDGSNSTIELQKRIYDEKDEKKFNSYGLNVSVDVTDRSTSLLNGPEQFLNFNSTSDRTILKAGNSLLNLTLTDEKSFLQIQPDSAILQIQKTEGKTTETSNLVLNHDSFTAKISSKGEFLKIDKDSSRFSHKYKDGSKEYESYLLLNTVDGITMETPGDLLVHAGEKAYFYTTGYKSTSSNEEKLTRNYIKMEGDDFELHSQKGGILSLYSGFKVTVNKEEKKLKLTSSTLSNNLTILGDTKENKGLYFTSAPNGLLIERYQEQRGSETWDSNMYVLRRNSPDDKDHALRVKGNVLVDEALKATKSISSDYFSGRIIDITGDNAHICFLNPSDPEDFSAIIDRNDVLMVRRRVINGDFVTSINKNGNLLSWSTIQGGGGTFSPESKTYTLQKAEFAACQTPTSVSSFSEVTGALAGLANYCNSLRGAYYSLSLV